MKRLIIAIDCDDVLVNTSSRIIDRYNQKYGTNVTLECDAYNEESDWQADSHETAIRRVDTILRDEQLLRDSVPLPGAVDAIRRLAEHHELHVVTGRQPYMEKETIQLLTRWFEGCFQSLEMTNYGAASDSVTLRRSKGEVCKALGVDMLIDDHTFHLANVLSVGVKELIMFGDYPWNRRQPVPPEVVRCVNWEATEREIQRIVSL